VKYACSMDTIQQNGRFTLFSSKFPYNINSILFACKPFFYSPFTYVKPRKIFIYLVGIEQSLWAYFYFVFEVVNTAVYRILFFLNICLQRLESKSKIWNYLCKVLGLCGSFLGIGPSPGFHSSRNFLFHGLGICSLRTIKF